MSFSKSFAVFIAFIAWFALGLQLYIMIDNVPENGLTTLTAITRFLLYFTILSNLLVAICLTTRAAEPSNNTGKFFSNPSILAAITVYIFIVAVVYNVVLRKLWVPEGNQRLADELLHVIIPVLYILYWFLFAPKYGLSYLHPFRWLLFPACYLIYALIRGNIEGFYPYPFIDLTKNSYGQIAINSLFVMIAFIITGLIIVFVSKKMIGKKTI